MRSRAIVPKKSIPDYLLPKVAIVGRPSVGKSALFNRLASGNKAIVVDEPGVTRDRLYGRSFWGDFEFMVVDTGGVLTVSKSQANVMEELAISTTVGMDGIPLASREAAVARMPSMIEKQATAAVDESSVIIFLVDGQAGLTAADEEISDWLRRNYSDKFIILAVNKCESPRKGVMQASEFWSLGFTPLPISAISGTGTGELLDLVCSGLKKIEDPDKLAEEEEYIPAIAIVGRPNVGKSSILNALVGEDRTIVSPVSGTTRDAIDIEFTGPYGQKFWLIDTAGIRRKAVVASSGSVTEALSVNKAFRAIRRSDVVALVIEAVACITEQDCKIAERIEKEGKGCLIVVNKWDTIPNKNQQTATYYEQDVREKLRILDWAPVVYSIALAGRSVDKIIMAASTVEKERCRRLTTAVVNQVVQEALAFKAPPKTRGGKRGRIYYSTQAAIRPPTFVFFVNYAKLFPETYRRYMEKQLRSDAGFAGTPIRLLWSNRRKTERDEGQFSSLNNLPEAIFLNQGLGTWKGEIYLEVAFLEDDLVYGMSSGWQLRFNPQGTMLAAAGGGSASVKVWDTSTWSLVATLLIPRPEGTKPADKSSSKKFVLSVAWFRRIACGSMDGTVSVFDTDRCKFLHHLEGHCMPVRSLVFSPVEPRLLFTGSDDQHVHMYDAEGKTQVGSMSGHNGWVLSVDASTDGAALTTGSSDRTVKLWDIGMKAAVQTMSNHNDQVWGVAFRPGGMPGRLASVSDDKSISLYDYF